MRIGIYDSQRIYGLRTSFCNHLERIVALNKHLKEFRGFSNQNVGYISMMNFVENDILYTDMQKKINSNVYFNEKVSYITLNYPNINDL